MEAMIFAAGLGTRLYPLTKDKPKALVEIAGKTLLDRTIEKLIKAKVERIVINAHHYADKIENHLNQNHYPVEIILSKEEELLNTGGGLKAAKKHFSLKRNILIHNVDIISDIDLKELCSQLENTNSLALLAVSKRASSRQLLFNQDKQLCGWRNLQSNKEIITRKEENIEEFAFSGVHIIRPEFFNYMPQEEIFSITDHYLTLSKTEPIKAYEHKDIMWYDLGKYEQIAQIESQLNQSDI